MNFNSAEFMVFLTVVLVLYAVVFRRELARNLLLLSASYFFYMSWNWKYAGLIALSTVVDYVVALALAGENRQGRRKRLLIVSLVLNLGLLGLFKYYNFFVDLAQGPLTVFGHDVTFLQHHLLLPVGISFYTFQTLSYTIDVYRREIPCERNFVNFALFVSFFPQLVAGPIVRAAHFLPQLHRTPQVSEARFASGMWLMFQGLFKKIVIADLLAGLGVDAVFADPSRFSSLDLLLALYGYAFQIYNDFSGYSDIAIGVARMLGFELPINFNRPYLAENVREFWSRWHITLSTWLRDYLYIPLGGNRCGPWRVKFNLMVTMLLGGLWHGAAIHFVLWGCYHGLLLCAAHGTPRSAPSASPLTRLRRQFVCFHLVVFGWLLFRIGTWDALASYLAGLAQLSGGTALSPLYVGVLALAFLTHVVPRSLFDTLARWWCQQPAFLQGAGYAGLVLAFVGLSLGTPSFIYFQF